MAIGPDRVQVLKQESAALGGDAADDVPYTTAISPQEDAIETAGIYLQDASNRDEQVYLERAGNDLRAVDVSNPSGISLSELVARITPAQHKALDTLVHELAEDAFTELVFTGDDLTSIVTWTSPAKTTKIREATLSYTGDDLTTAVSIQYAADGTTVLEEVTSTLTYSGGDLESVEEALT